MIIYKLVEEIHDNDMLGHYTSFGIKASDSFSERENVYLEDVFTDPETANYLMSCFISSIYLQKNITSLNSTHLALPRKLAVLFQDSLGVCNVSLKTVIEENGNINFKRTLINRNGIMIGEQLARNMGFFEHLDPNFVKTLKNIKY